MDSGRSTGEVSEVLCSRMSRLRLSTCCNDSAPLPLGTASAAVRRSPAQWELRPRRALAAAFQVRRFRQLRRVLQKFRRPPIPCIVFRGDLAPPCGRECLHRGMHMPPCTLWRTGSGTLSNATPTRRSPGAPLSRHELW